MFNKITLCFPSRGKACKNRHFILNLQTAHLLSGICAAHRGAALASLKEKNCMKKKIIIALGSLFMLLVGAAGLSAQESRNNSADGIIGNYFIDYNGEQSKVRCYKEADGTYEFLNYWSKNMYDKNGNIYLDTKNPDKELRNKPCNEMIIMWNLKYDPEKKHWKGKIYDPTSGIRADATVQFTKDNMIAVRGSIMGIGKTVRWKPIAAE